jgi:large subunit ribosomal protein L13
VGKTFVTQQEDVQREWFVVDATGRTLGRLATRVANVLRGKHKPLYSPAVDTGDYVIVVNAEKIHVTGRKLDQKMYYRHSGYPGGLREIPLRKLLQRHPTRAVEHAVRGMLPKNRLGRRMLKKLKVYAGPDHPHEAQQPKELELN